MTGTAEKLQQALTKRQPLLARADTQIWRALSGESDGLPGIYVDIYGPAAVMNVYEGKLPTTLSIPQTSAALLQLLHPLGIRAVYVKPFVRDRSRLGGQLPPAVTNPDPTAAGGAGEPLGQSEGGQLTVREKSWNLEVRLYDGLSTGVFIDQRENRAWVHHLAASRKNLRVLNTFSYTCPFSVAAAVGGAKEVTSVDVSGKYLDWGKRNLTLNHIDPAAHRFARMDTFEFFAYAKRKSLAYDLIILDPPSFGSGNKRKGIRAWSAVDDYARLVRQAAELLTPRGVILASTNNTELSHPGRLEREITTGLSTRRPRWLELPPAGEDIRAERGRVAWRAFELA